MNTVQICNQEIQIKEYNGQRVVTFKDIDRLHKRPDGTARKRFNDNRKRFVEEENFYKISASVFRAAIGNMDERQQNDIILITESGYLMLVKSFTDDLAWKVQRELTNCYFKLKEIELEITQVDLSEQSRIKIGEIISKCSEHNLIALLDVYRLFISQEVFDYYMKKLRSTNSKTSISVKCPSNIGKLISKGLQDKNMTQKELAEKLDCAKSSVSNYVNGKSKPCEKQLKCICEILGVSC